MLFWSLFGKIALVVGVLYLALGSKGNGRSASYMDDGGDEYNARRRKSSIN